MKLDKLLANSFPISKAEFVKAVNNARSMPEAGFDIDSNVPGRRVSMYLTTLGLVCEQDGIYFMTSLDNQSCVYQ
jgi:hypothetical protein